MSRTTFTSGNDEDYYRNNARKKKKKSSPLFAAIFSILILTSLSAAAVYFEIPYIPHLFFSGLSDKKIKIQESSVISVLVFKSDFKKAKNSEKLNNVKSMDDTNGLLPENGKETNSTAKNMVVEVKEKNETKVIEMEKISVQKKQTTLFFPRNESYVKKGEGIFGSAKEIKKKMKMTDTEFIIAWYSSKVLIHGKKISIEEIGLVPMKTKIIYEINDKIFKIILPRGGKIGVYRDLYNIYLSKKKRAPKWLLAKIGMGSDIAAQELLIKRKEESVVREGYKKSIERKLEEKIKNPIFPPVPPRILNKQEETLSKSKIKAKKIIFKQRAIIKT